MRKASVTTCHARQAACIARRITSVRCVAMVHYAMRYTVRCMGMGMGMGMVHHTVPYSCLQREPTSQVSQEAAIM